MERQLLRWEVNGAPLVMETDDDDLAGWTSASALGDRIVHNARVRFEDALSSVRDAALIALRTFREGPDDSAPDEIELEFGVKFGSEAGAMIAKTTLEGQFTVRLTWAAADAARGGTRAQPANER
jgi:Trypsin-co-occurring domain 1